MSRAWRYFHCTNGRELAIDREGVAMRSEDRVRSHAAKVVQDAVASCDGSFDWSGWMVDVHDANGRRVMLLDFAEIIALVEPSDERMAA